MLNELLSLVLVYLSLGVIKGNNDAIMMQRCLCCWCALTLAWLLTEICWVNGPLTKIMLLIMCLGADGSLAESLVHQVILPHWDRIEQQMRMMGNRLASEIKVRSLFWCTTAMDWYGRRTGAIPSGGEGGHLKKN